MVSSVSVGKCNQSHVLQSTLDEDCRQAEEPKQHVDEASQFRLGRQCQHSAVICSDAFKKPKKSEFRFLKKIKT